MALPCLRCIAKILSNSRPFDPLVIASVPALIVDVIHASGITAPTIKATTTAANFHHFGFISNFGLLGIGAVEDQKAVPNIDRNVSGKTYFARSEKDLYGYSS